MLTGKYMLKVARMRERMGDLRPGYLHDSVSSLTGPYGLDFASRRRKKGKHVKEKSRGGTVTVWLEFGEDKKTGGTRIVRRK